ncbi:hypothetical protein ACFW96_11355 [Streptomyces gardneri]|uniref:hypothetical protein n=1 Tax=Streptomyces gardneri TaxID=66892 RepID=UPI0036910C78
MTGEIDDALKCADLTGRHVATGVVAYARFGGALTVLEAAAIPIMESVDGRESRSGDRGHCPA